MDSNGRRKYSLNVRILLAAILLAGTWLLASPLADAAPRSGSPVFSFGTGGKTLTGFAPRADDGRVGEMLMEPDGSAVVLGYSNRNFVLSRFGPDGVPDPAFGTDGFVTGGFAPDGRRFSYERLALQSDGKILLSGESVADPGASSGMIVRYGPDGRFDRSFGTKGMVSIPDDVDLLGVDGRDRLFVVTAEWKKTTISRYFPNGHLDRSFGQAGSVTHTFQSSSGFNLISFAGNRITIGAPYGIMRLMNDGSLDQGFANHGVSRYGGYRLAVDPQGRVIIATGSGQFKRLLDDGSLDHDFGDDGLVSLPTGADRAIGIDNLGRLVFGGVTPYLGPGSIQQFDLIRLTPTGDLDPGFGGDGQTIGVPYSGGKDEIVSLATAPDGGVLVAGTSQPPGWISKFTLARYTEDGELDPTYGLSGGFTSLEPILATNDQVLDAVQFGRGRIVAVGRSGPMVGIAGYTPNGKPDPDFGGNGRVATRFTEAPFGDLAQGVVGLNDGAVAVCSGSSAGVTVARYTAAGDRDPAFAANGIALIPQLRRCGAIVRDGRGRLVLAGMNADNVTGLARLNGDGSGDLSFGSGGTVSGPAFSPSGGGFRDVDLDLAPNGDLIIAGDRFGVTVARFTEDGARRPGFGENGVLRLDGFDHSPLRMGRAETVAVTSDGRILIGGINRKQMTVVALNPHGQPVRKFGKRGVASRKVRDVSVVEDLQIQSDGAIVTAGSTRNRCLVFRFNCDESVVVGKLSRRGKFDRRFGRKGLVIRSVGKKSRATTILTGRRGITVAGFAEVPDQRRQFMLLRLKP